MSPEWFAVLASSARALVGELGREVLFSTIVFAIVLGLCWIRGAGSRVRKPQKEIHDAS